MISVLMRCARAWFPVSSTLLILVTVVGCGGSSEGESKTTESESDELISVASVNYPLHYFAERVGGEAVQALLPVSEGVDPAFWKPGIEELGVYQQADLILLNGADYAKWVPLVSLPASKLVNSSAAFSDQYIQVENAVTHSHGPGTEHAHTGTAFTTWLDFEQAIAQARTVLKALQAARPASSAEFAGRFEALETALHELDTEMLALGRLVDGRPLFASHPIYQYLARRYELNLRAVSWEPDETPAVRQWQEFERLLDAHPATIMLWEGEPLPRVRERLSQLGVRCVVFDPASQPSSAGDFLDRMHQNMDGLRTALH